MMSTYIIGDIHGCYQSLQNLLTLINIGPQDRIWCVGDLINRGPKSLDVLRWAMHNEDRVQIILGNHELHFLACLYGAKTTSGDTFNEFFELDDLELKVMIEWLRKQPILYEGIIKDKHIAMVHAGVNATWTWGEVRQRAKMIESQLITDEGLLALAKAHPSRKKLKTNTFHSTNTENSYLFQKESHPIDHRLAAKPPTPKAQWIDDLKWFTRVRTIDKNGLPVGWFKGNENELPQDLTPWFKRYEYVKLNSISQEFPDRLFYGHWAAFGIQEGSCYYGLDSACIWGQSLSAISIEDNKLFQVQPCESVLTPKHLRD